MTKEFLQTHWSINTQEIGDISPNHALVDIPNDGDEGSVYIFSTEGEARRFIEQELSGLIGKTLILYGLDSLIEMYADNYPTYILDCNDVDHIELDDRKPWNTLKN